MSTKHWEEIKSRTPDVVGCVRLTVSVYWFVTLFVRFDRNQITGSYPLISCSLTKIEAKEESDCFGERPR
jgi:hypothetical protein